MNRCAVSIADEISELKYLIEVLRGQSVALDALDDLWQFSPTDAFLMLSVADRLESVCATLQDVVSELGQVA